MIKDSEEMEEGEENTWGLLVDSGYQGLQHVIPTVILPEKKRAGRRLTRQQQKFNKELASERVICERYYGRMKGYYRIMTSKYRNTREEYATVFRICVALTNYHLISNPL